MKSTVNEAGNAEAPSMREVRAWISAREERAKGAERNLLKQLRWLIEASVHIAVEDNGVEGYGEPMAAFTSGDRAAEWIEAHRRAQKLLNGWEPDIKLFHLSLRSFDD